MAFPAIFTFNFSMKRRFGKNLGGASAAAAAVRTVQF